ncbi:MAG: molybdopterin molybdotransferase MoeA [Deltaproteobacteria bacterium]
MPLRGARPIVSVEQAKQLVLENSEPLAAVQVPLLEAKGYVLAEDVISPLSLPLFTNSAMDGYALRSADIKGACDANPVNLSVAGVIKAGDFPDFTLQPTEAAKIMTGGCLPLGADSVLMVEYSDESAGALSAKRETAPGENVRYEGEELRAGDVALPKGAYLNAASVGFLAELGAKSLSVHRKPNVALLVTGQELVGYYEEPGRGKIRDSNSVAIRSAIATERAEFLFLGRVGDCISQITEKLDKGFEWADVILITGGVSVGDYDYVREVMEKFGVRSVFWRVSQRPGGPLFFGRIRNTLVFGLPGNPASTLVCFYEYVLPSIRRMLGRRDTSLLEIDAILVDEVRKKGDKTHFLRGLLRKEGGSFYVQSAGFQGSHIMKSFALSNCLIVAPQGESYIPAGSRVKAHLLPE